MSIVYIFLSVLQYVSWYWYYGSLFVDDQRQTHELTFCRFHCLQLVSTARIANLKARLRKFDAMFLKYVHFEFSTINFQSVFLQIQCLKKITENVEFF